MSSDTDKALAEDVIARWGGVTLTRETKQSLKVEIVTALSAVRKEEREAAFKVLCVDCAEGDTPILDEQARWYYHGERNDAVGCSASKLRLEAAATAKEERDA